MTTELVIQKDGNIKGRICPHLSTVVLGATPMGQPQPMVAPAFCTINCMLFHKMDNKAQLGCSSLEIEYNLTYENPIPDLIKGGVGK
jgi:hypothetical protein